MAGAVILAAGLTSTAVSASAAPREAPTIHQRRTVPMVTIKARPRPRPRHLSGRKRNEMLAVPMVAQRGWSSRQFGCLDRLWARESGWNAQAYNPWSGAYGIPQALPGEKMRSAGASWRTDPRTQIKWGLGYIGGRYGSPCEAWSHSLATGWY